MDSSESPGSHHGGHGCRAAGLASALPFSFPGTGPGGKRIPEAGGGAERACKHPGARIHAESSSVYDGRVSMRARSGFL
eukprot:14115604-Heterocapsa_arctica.AAC.1